MGEYTYNKTLKAREKKSSRKFFVTLGHSKSTYANGKKRKQCI